MFLSAYYLCLTLPFKNLVLPGRGFESSKGKILGCPYKFFF